MMFGDGVFETDRGPMNGDKMIDELVYRSYRFNRERFPEIPPERWRTVYPDADAMERRYQERADRYAAVMIQKDRLTR